ncbi:MAG: hypothetical protein WCP62_16870, partial [Planctomycetota bacterium]
MVRSAVHGLPVVCVGIVTWLFVLRLNQVTWRPLHEPYENRTAKQPSSPMISEKSSTIKQPYARSAPS